VGLRSSHLLLIPDTLNVILYEAAGCNVEDSGIWLGLPSMTQPTRGTHTLGQFGILTNPQEFRRPPWRAADASQRAGGHRHADLFAVSCATWRQLYVPRARTDRAGRFHPPPRPSADGGDGPRPPLVHEAGLPPDSGASCWPARTVPGLSTRRPSPRSRAPGHTHHTTLATARRRPPLRPGHSLTTAGGRWHRL